MQRPSIVVDSRMILHVCASLCFSSAVRTSSPLPYFVTTGLCICLLMQLLLCFVCSLKINPKIPCTDRYCKRKLWLWLCFCVQKLRIKLIWNGTKVYDYETTMYITFKLTLFILSGTTPQKYIKSQQIMYKKRMNLQVWYMLKRENEKHHK